MPNSVWMKQNVLIKTVVTQQFKDSYLKELEGALTASKQSVEKIKSSLSQVILRGGVGGQYDDLIKAQLQEEKAKQEQMVMDLEAKKGRSSQAGTRFGVRSGCARGDSRGKGGRQPVRQD